MDKILNKIKELLNSFKREVKTTVVPVATWDEKDVKNFGAAVIAGSALKSDIPNYSFVVFDPEQKDQKDSYFCTNYMLSYMSDVTEDVVTSPCFNYAKYKELYNRPIAELGAPLFQMILTRCKVGIPKKELWDYPGNNQNWYANAKNIPANVVADALNHLAKSAFEIEVERGWSKFESAIAYMNKLKVLIGTGADGHAITLIGKLKAGDDFYDLPVKNPFHKTFNEDMIITKDSYSKAMNYRLGYSNNGYRFFTANEVAGFFGLYLIFDMPRALAELLNLYNNKAVKGTEDKCYLIKNGVKNYIPNKETAWCFGIRLWGDVIFITDEELNKIPDGIVLKSQDGLYYNLINEVINTQNKSL